MAVAVIKPFAAIIAIALLGYSIVMRILDHKESQEINSKVVNSLLDEMKEIRTHVSSIKLKLGFKPNKE